MQRQRAKVWFSILAVMAFGCGQDPNGHGKVDPSKQERPMLADAGASRPATEYAAGAHLTEGVDAARPIALEVAEPTNDKPVSLALGVMPASAKPGTTIRLVLQGKTAPQWHLYAVNKPTGVSKPTVVTLRLPRGVSAAGAWILPDPKKDPHAPDETWIYEGEFRFEQPLAIAADAPTGKAEIVCDIQLQACQADLCLPPEKRSLKAVVEITP